MTTCSQTGHCILSSIGCFIYDFQTLLVGIAAIVVAVFAGIPVWRQLKDSNLQARISHRETLATLLRAALRRYAEVEKAVREPMSFASRVTSDPIGEPVDIEAEDAHHLENMLHSVLDWYLVHTARYRACRYRSRQDDVESSARPAGRDARRGPLGRSQRTAR